MTPNGAQLGMVARDTRVINHDVVVQPATDVDDRLLEWKYLRPLDDQKRVAWNSARIDFSYLLGGYAACLPVPQPRSNIRVVLVVRKKLRASLALGDGSF